MGTEQFAASASLAVKPYGRLHPRQRAGALVAVASALGEEGPSLVSLARSETGLGRSRLESELRRTVAQLRLFAELIFDGSYLDARLDAADDSYATGRRPDLRRVLTPVGPVLNFAASNFPFAFSVAGGDTVSALAAGCPVIVKAHPGHPALARATAVVVGAVLANAGLPAGVFQLVEGQQAGIDLLNDDRIKAAAFTGSLRAGRMLADIAAARPRPIPFFGELGSVNPVYVTTSAAKSDHDLINGFIASVSGSAGQLCTKPGFLFMPSSADLSGVRTAASLVPEHRLLNPRIGEGYEERRNLILGTDGVDVLARGSVREHDGQWYVTPTIVTVDSDVLRESRGRLLDECFGPLSIIVRYTDLASLPNLHMELFPGNLTSTIHATDADRDVIAPLVDVLSETSGRVIFDGWPTGVSVTSAMQHGGPYPATTMDATSVGTAAISRFLRGVAYQDTPEPLLPPALQTSNPWHIPQRHYLAGRSSGWGTLTSTV